ncbi:MAG: DUF1902 domain-containing protein [Bauldia sp.]|nr:DUF1902 domain-containing protein [Bauldia sp.]
MNAFAAIVPEHRSSYGPAFDVNDYRAPDSDLWIAEADALPVATEERSLDLLIARVVEIAPGIAELNGHRGPLNPRFVLSTASAT